MTTIKRSVPVVRVVRANAGQRTDALPMTAHLALVEELRDAEGGAGKVADRPLCHRGDFHVADEDAVAAQRAQHDQPPLPMRLRELPTCPRCETIRSKMRKAGSCGKVMRWRTQAAAEKAMDRLNARSAEHPLEHPLERPLVRAYECFGHRDPCWHVTSLEGLPGRPPSCQAAR